MSNFFPLFFIPSGTQHIFPSSPFLGYHFLTHKKSVKTKRFLLTSGATYYICSKLFSRQLISASLHCTPFKLYYISHCFTVPFIKFPCLIQLHTRTVIPEQKLRALHGGSRNPYGEIFPLPDVLSLLDFSTGNVLGQRYLVDCFCTANLCEPREAVAVHQSRFLLPSPFQSTWPVLWAGWAAQDCSRHGGCLGLVSANFAS